MASGICHTNQLNTLLELKFLHGFYDPTSMNIFFCDLTSVAYISSDNAKNRIYMNNVRSFICISWSQTVFSVLEFDVCKIKMI